MREDAIEKFRKIYTDNPDVAIHRGRVTESDTRANVLDRLIHDVLEWPRTIGVVDREPFANPGFIDYRFSHGRPLLLLEAKAAGVTFSFPYRKNRRRSVKIESTLFPDKPLKEAVVQVQSYCNNTGCRFAVATNGYSFVIFRAISEGTSWMSLPALVFYDLRDIDVNFTEFWNLLSYEAVIDGKLDAAFRTSSSPSRGYYRPLDARVDSDATYSRNPLNVFLRPYIDKFFGDIAVQDTVEILNECYVYSRPIQVIDAELKLAIEDQAPKFAPSAQPVQHSQHDPGGAIGRQITSAVVGRASGGAMIIVMGGIGSGKSTFCRRFFRIVAPGLVSKDGKAMLVYLDFLGAPDEPQQLEDFVWQKVSESLKRAELSLGSRSVLEKIFKSDIDMTCEVYGRDDEATPRRISDLIFRSYQDDRKFGEAALRYCAAGLKMPVVVFDNVDQLRLNAQVQLFTTSQRFANAYGCVSLLVLREESYSSALLKKHLTATTIRPYHLSSPSFRELITARIRSAAAAAKAQAQLPEATAEQREYAAVLSLFELLDRSILGRNGNIIRLVESIAYGNMRLALNLFNSFITSGATDVPKIIRLYHQRGGYTVPFHEFAKSVILGDYQYYRDTRSLIGNLFEVSRKPNASHFTSLRILNYLACAPVSQGGGHEIRGLHELLSEIDEAFGNEEDCKDTLLRLISVERQLVELDTRRTDTLDGAASARITAAGAYYLRFLANAFAYCDLVWHDTPFADRGICDSLIKAMGHTEMERRFTRVDAFLAYLRREEEQEFDERGLDYELETVWGPFIPRIKRHIEREKSVIRRRLSIPNPGPGAPS